ncbi:hypothetical protein [Streptomyces sp. NBC_00620]|uniref:hypothetical protein n=1 Tax=Streptomyces sp. NBC_00620 TaxID=2903666 RepID=UPI0022592A4F|nr:hypothetical protein [Streptomyces sp. NBC_00620]MCX4972778.1 hypothetical protein [Streptomyces sp. NBC_00620]
MADGSDSREWGSSDAKDTASRTTIITGGGYPDTGLVVAHRRERGQAKGLRSATPMRWFEPLAQSASRL